MTEGNLPSRRRRFAVGAACPRASTLLLAACLLLEGMLAARPALGQAAAAPSWQPTQSGTPWRQARRRRAIAEPRVAQTPAQGAPGSEYPADTSDQYQGSYDYDGNYTTERGYDYAAEGEPPVENEEGGFGPEGDADFGPAGGPYCQEPSGHGCTCFDWHGFYVRADYLLWWGKGFAAPPLVTTSVAGTPREEAGVLGLPTTSVLFPQGNFADTIMHGGRVRLGYWVDPCDTAAVEGTYYALGKSTTHFNASDQDFPILARPFVNIETDAVGNEAELVAYPGLFSGEISVLGSSQLQGADVILRHALCRDCDWRVDCLVGWRYNRLDEALVVSDSKTVLSGQTGLTVGTMLSEWDRFSTRNTFNGVVFGFITERRWCRWWLETRTTLALGNSRAQVTIDGQQTAVVPLPGGGQQVVVTPAGLLAQSTNIGTYADDNFTVIPQLGVNLGWEITCGLWATVGYNFLYWCNVARPGDQIDTDVNLSQLSPGGLVGLARPAFTGITSDYWAQGLNVGLAYRF
jgi:hypothetical protein